jgi:putative component of membrane protein insertase Oxa1/YidC/SpoIIIJ protein YidD
MKHVISLVKLCFILSLSMCAEAICAQSNSAFTQKMLSRKFQSIPTGGTPTRSFLKKENESGTTRAVSGGMIFFYQNILSEQIQADCTFETTCSQYLKVCIARYGFFKGVFAGLNQYTSCIGPGADHHAAHRLNEEGKVINKTEDETGN